MARIGRGIKAFGRLIWRIVTFPFRLLWRCVCAVGRGIRAVYRAIIRGIKAVYRAIIATPGNTIRGIIRFGKWLYRTALMIRTKVEYLQTESQKWKVFFSTLKDKSPKRLIASNTPDNSFTCPVVSLLPSLPPPSITWNSTCSRTSSGIYFSNASPLGLFCT